MPIIVLLFYSPCGEKGSLDAAPSSSSFDKDYTIGSRENYSRRTALIHCLSNKVSHWREDLQVPSMSKASAFVAGFQMKGRIEFVLCNSKWLDVQCKIDGKQASQQLVVLEIWQGQCFGSQAELRNMLRANVAVVIWEGH